MPQQLGSLEHARQVTRALVDWYNDDHYHVSLALLHPVDVHHGRAAEIVAVRQRVLDEALVRHPERFVRGRPVQKTRPRQRGSTHHPWIRSRSRRRIGSRRSLLVKFLARPVSKSLTGAAADGLYKVGRPEIESWDFEQYARLLASAKVEGANWYAAACLAGEAGLRSGEIKAHRWREDVDLIAKTVTVNQQTCHGETTTPKGRTRRTIPMTSTLEWALRRLDVVRNGFVVRNPDGSAMRDGQMSHAIERI